MAFSVLSLNVEVKQDDQETTGISMAASAKIGCSIFAGDIFMIILLRKM